MPVVEGFLECRHLQLSFVHFIAGGKEQDA